MPYMAKRGTDKMAKAKSELTNLTFKGQITATSKKQDGDYKQEIPTKTAYVTTDEETAKKLVEFGLQEYTSKADQTSFFILKFPASLMVYYKSGAKEKRPDLSQITLEGLETNNFKTPDEKLIGMNIIKGNHKNNDFFRLQAIQVEQMEDIEEIIPENPFETEDLPF